MAAKTLFVVSMAVAMTVVGARRAHPQEARDQGHLMLPPQRHSRTGVMRRNFDTDSRTIRAFTQSEATAIGRRLSEG